jgi:hypothetical protein
MNKAALLTALRFGARVAEDEADLLENYFVETDQWNRIYGDEVDIVYGPKGAGKSAIYALINRRTDDLFDRNVLLVTAETPRGAPAFSELVADPPPNEYQFVILWKLYIACLVAQKIRDFGLAKGDEKQLIHALENAGLLPQEFTLYTLLRSVKSFIARALQREADSVEHAMSYDPESNIPTLSRKVVFKAGQESASDVQGIPVDDLLRKADTILFESGYTIWIAIDRLDVAFIESRALERNALRALFRVYSDMRALRCMTLKIFVREDIWSRITEGGFTEASHIVRTVHIRWDHNSLLNLVIRRLLSNDEFIRFYAIDVSTTLASFDEQQALITRVFPEQIDTGRNPKTFGWIIARTQDASGAAAPREIIHLLEAARDAQISRMNRGEKEPDNEWLFERAVFKEALRIVSAVRYNQTLLAEYPEHRDHLEALKAAKAEQTPRSLSRLWNIEEQKAIEIAKQLHGIGFFEIRGTREEPSYWVPFLYRDALELVQGRAD